jgi:CRP-like cAMP-binding protein
MQFSRFLETLPEFADFNRSELDTLERIMLVRNYPDGYEFIREGASPNGVYLAIEGDIAVTHFRGNGRGSVELKRMRPGELFGLAALIDHGRSSASCRALGDTRVAFLPRAAFKLMYSANSPLAGHFLRMVARQLMHDYRTLVEALSRNIFETSEAAASPELSAVLLRYTGPERRREGAVRSG